MYCPKCGQFQVSGTVQFCTRCGLSLKVIRDVITNDAVAPIEHETGTETIGLSQRQKGTRAGAKLVFWGLASAPISLLFGLVADSPFLFFFSLLTVFIGTVRMVYARLFEEVRSPPKHDVLSVSPKSFSSSTKEITTPHSVTEHTTKLLDS